MTLRIAAVFVVALVASGHVFIDQSRLRIRQVASAPEDPGDPEDPPPTGGNSHDYFNSLVGRGDHFFSKDMRSSPLCGGKTGGYFTYDFANDPDPRKIDGAKFALPSGVTSATTNNGCTWVFNGPDAHTYLITWDVLWTDDWVFANHGIPTHKAFQIEEEMGGDYNGSGLFVETRCRFTGANELTAENGDGHPVTGYSSSTDVCNVDIRGYGGSTSSPSSQVQPLNPSLNAFLVKPNKVTRYWVRIQYQFGSFHTIDAWVADEDRAVVHIVGGAKMSSRSGATGGINAFWFEFNSSTDPPRPINDPGGDLVAYVRNLVVLQDPPSDISSLLVQPVR